MSTFSISEAFRAGWELFKKRPAVIIAALLVTGFLNVGIQYRFGPEDGYAPPVLVMIVVAVAAVVIGTLAEIGMTTFTLRAHDSIDSVAFKDIWNPAPFFRYLFGKILLSIVVLIGFVLLIIPGLVLSFGLMFAPYLIIDKGLGPVEALKESWRITKGYKWRLVLFSLAVCGLNILGLLALVVGLLVTIPVSMLAVVHVYRKLEHTASEVAPVSV